MADVSPTSVGRSLILASGSPRRIEMMQAHGYDPLVLPAEIEENVPLHHSMTDTVTYLALKKARDVEARWLSGNRSCADAVDAHANETTLHQGHAEQNDPGRVYSSLFSH